MPKTLRRQKSDENVINLQRLLSSHGYFHQLTPPNGIFEDITHNTVILFQLQHVGENGNFLKPDGVVGDKTWWALKNPSGNVQRNFFKYIIPDGLTVKRRQLLEIIFEEHAKPVFEVPDGSNRSPDIDGYWGQTGIIGHPWCCAFVSCALYDLLGFYPIDGKHHLGVQNMWRSARRSNMETGNPKPGDIFIQIKTSGTGHTGFVVGLSAEGKSVYTCEGNCGNRLKVGKRNIESITHFIDCLSDGQTIDFERRDFETGKVENAATR